MQMLQRIFVDEEGATAVEYGLIAGLVAVAVMVSLTALDDSITELFENTSATMSMTEF
ncbi:MAG TPA: Flp family type IVb pilin [Deltaproteobacteria bacterium]|nr:Flp family type IVb pilin [Deltaproteobacteria bacterium]